MADPNKVMTDNAIRALERRLEHDRKINFPAAMRKVGKEIIQYTKDTHEYQNQSGKLERSHKFVVIPPGESANIEIKTSNGVQTFNFSSSANVLRLILYTGEQYGLWVELKSGLNVLIHGFLKLRREFKSMFKSAFSSRRIG